MPDAAKSLNMHSGNKTNRSLNSGVPRLILLFGRPRVRIQAVQHLTSYNYSAIPCFTKSSKLSAGRRRCSSRPAIGPGNLETPSTSTTQIRLPLKNCTHQAQASSSPVAPKFLVLPAESEKQAPFLQAAQPRSVSHPKVAQSKWASLVGKLKLPTHGLALQAGSLGHDMA